MTRAAFAFIVVSIAVALAGLIAHAMGGGAAPSAAQASAPAPPDALKAQPLAFIENAGQTDDAVAFHTAGGAAPTYFTDTGATIGLPRGDRRYTLRHRFGGSAALRMPRARQPVKARVSFFHGPRAQWRTGLRAYGEVQYAGVWPGVDVAYSGPEGRLKYTLTVHPGADPDRIRLRYDGATKLRLTRGGRLDVITPGGRFHDDRPVAYQVIGGRRVTIPARFRVSKAHRAEYAFALGAYDVSRPLVIDPEVLVYAGYLGGDGIEESKGIAVDDGGNAYVIGVTTSATGFPSRVGPDTTHNGMEDVFVAKLDPAGQIVYAGFIGGAGNDDDGRTGIDVDSQGRAYVTGTARSGEATFPVIKGPDLTYNGGTEDAFVARINAAGTSLDYSGYVGGVKGDAGRGNAADDDGNQYFTGVTESDQSTLPVRVGPDLAYGGAPRDCMVGKVDTNGQMVYLGYIGGAGDDTCRDAEIDDAGNVYTSGRVTATEATFPVRVGPDLTYNGGSYDAFAAKVNAAGTDFDYLGYIGGERGDQPRGVAVGADGAAYVTGVTESNQSTFPVTVGPDLTYNQGARDGFVAKVAPNGDHLDYAGYVGGFNQEEVFGAAVDPDGNLYVTGFTNSPERSFPIGGGPDSTYNGGTSDAFVARVRADGLGLDWSGYIGGAEADEGTAIARSSSGELYVSGQTHSPPSSFPALGGPGASLRGTGDAFVARIAKIVPRITVAASGPVDAGVPFTVTAVASDASGHVIPDYQAPATWRSLSGNLSPAVPAPFVDGVSRTTATFAQPYRGARISVTAEGVTASTARFDVLGPLAGILLSGTASTVLVGQPFTVRALARDALGSVITSYTGPATWADRSGSLTPATPNAFRDGVSTTSARIGRAIHDDRVTLTSGGKSATTAPFLVLPR